MKKLKKKAPKQEVDGNKILERIPKNRFRYHYSRVAVCLECIPSDAYKLVSYIGRKSWRNGMASITLPEFERDLALTKPEIDKAIDWLIDDKLVKVEVINGQVLYGVVWAEVDKRNSARESKLIEMGILQPREKPDQKKKR